MPFVFLIPVLLSDLYFSIARLVIHVEAVRPSLTFQKYRIDLNTHIFLKVFKK